MTQHYQPDNTVTTIPGTVILYFRGSPFRQDTLSVLRKLVQMISLMVLILYSNEIKAQNNTNVGTDFWIAIPPNSGTNSLKIFISSATNTSGQVTSSFPGVNQTFNVIPGFLTELSCPIGIQLTSGIENKGIHITTTEPVSIYCLNFAGGTTDAYAAFQTESLGTSYRILSYKVTLLNSGSALGVVAPNNGTVLTFYNHQTGNTSTINLNQGQTYYFEETANGNDITGSTIESNLPVAVFGSVKIVNIPQGCLYGDHIVEQMMPLSSWGRNFITVSLEGRDSSGDIFRILADQNATSVTINGIFAATINSGDYHEVNLAGMNSISSDKPVLVAQYAKGTSCSGNLTGDPFMMLIPPREQFLMQYTIGSVAGFTSHHVNIVAPDYAINSIYEDGVLIPPSAFQVVGTTGYYGAQRTVSQGPHVYSGSFPFGVFVYGWTTVNSYGYPGGCSLSPVATVNSITLSPTNTSGILNTTLVCLTAHVENSNNEPVPDIRVDFNFTGLTTFTSSAFTNAQGDAEYCYTQTGTTPGIHNLTAQVSNLLSNQSSIVWSNVPCNDPSDGGTIGNDQSGCPGYNPVMIQSITLPSGESGTIEYKWQQSVTAGSGPYTDIINTDTPDYLPGTTQVTTWFRRLARVTCSTDWSGAAISNSVLISILPIPSGIPIKHQ